MFIHGEPRPDLLREETLGDILAETARRLFIDEDWFAGCLALTAAGLLFGQVCVFAVLAAKWLHIGRYRPMAAPMWTPSSG